MWLAAGLPATAWGQNAELATLRVLREDGEMRLDFTTRLTLPRPVEDALRRGVPLYFVAEAALYRPRWYWRDDRVARVRRTWRLAYQPLTSAWRVSLGALSQTFATLSEALVAISAAGDWRLVELSALDQTADHYLRFRYELDTSRLPSPLQISLGGQADWVVQLERDFPVPAERKSP